MSKLVKPLSDALLKRLKGTDKIYKKCDGQGLNIKVMPSGSKIWIHDYRFNGKDRVMSLGRYPDVSLALARELAQKNRALIAQGIDPLEKRKADIQMLEKRITLQELALKWLKNQVKSQRINEETARKSKRRLEIHLFPLLGSCYIADIDLRKVIQVFEDMPQTNNLYKINNALVKMFEYAELRGLVDKNPLKRLHSCFNYRQSKNQPTITPSELPKFFRTLHFSDVLTPTALLIEWQLLTMLRPNEAVNVRWSDVDFDCAKLHIPAERMKGGKRAHDVALSRQALAILKEMAKFRDRSDFIFQSYVAPYDRPMSNQTANNALKRMGYKDRLVAHGFRSIASTYLHDLDRFSAEAIELCLAHNNRNRVRAVYDKSTKWESRVKIMQAWGDYVEKCKIESLKS